MHFAPLAKKDRLAFRELLIPADGGKIGSAAALFFLSLTVIPFSYIEAAAGLYLIYAALFYFLLTRALSSLVAVAVPGVFLYGMTALIPPLPHPYLLPAVYAAVMMGGVGGAFLLVHCRAPRYLPLLLLPVAAYGMTALLLDPLRALLVLVPVALALVLGHAFLGCTAQTPTLLRLAAVLALCGIAAFLVWYAAIGWPVANPVVAFSDIVRRTVVAFYRNAEAQLAAQGAAVGLSEVDFSNLAALIGNILPGLCFATCAVMAFGIFRVFLRVLVCMGTISRVPLRLGALTISPFAAVLFLAAYLASVFAGADLFGTVCENIAIVLEPGLFLVGFASLLGREAGGKTSKLSFFLLIALLLLFFNYPTYAFSMAAVVGAVRVLIGFFFRRKKKEH